MGIDMIRKRDGREVPFDQDKIEQAIFASFQASGSARGHETSRKLTEEVVRLRSPVGNLRVHLHVTWSLTEIR